MDESPISTSSLSTLSVSESRDQHSIWYVLPLISPFKRAYKLYCLNSSDDKLDKKPFDLSLKALQCDTVRMTMSLQNHLNGETLPSVDNYSPSPQAIGSRATLDELHLGEVNTLKVIE